MKVHVITTGGTINKGCLVMNGRELDPARVSKNRERSCFEEDPPRSRPQIPLG
jgi:hypothetical protein